MAVFVMAPINAAFGPQIAHLHHTGNTRALSLSYKAATGWIVRLSLPAFVLLMVFPQDLLRLFGKEFQTAAVVTSVLAVGQLVNAATGPCGTLLNMSGKVAVNMVDNVSVLALNVGLNLWLIPTLGILGAGIAWSVSLACVNILRVLQVHQLLGVLPFSADTVKVPDRRRCIARGCDRCPRPRRVRKHARGGRRGCLPHRLRRCDRDYADQHRGSRTAGSHRRARPPGGIDRPGRCAFQTGQGQTRASPIWVAERAWSSQPARKRSASDRVVCTRTG